MSEIPLSHLLDTAICAAGVAGNHALENKSRRMESNATLAHDIKLVLDVECQAIAEKMIASEFPDHSILGEEGERENLSTEYEWIIDPIDGTLNFTHGFPYWCASVAVRRNGKILAGCVFAPESGQCYAAHIEAPAKLNGEPIQPSEIDRLQDALLFSGISRHLKAGRDASLDLFHALSLGAQKVRINGSAALDICHVAAGQCEGYIERDIYLWDYAAAGLIARQAGAILFTYPTNEPHGASVLCANPHLAEPLRALFTETPRP